MQEIKGFIVGTSEDVKPEDTTEGYLFIETDTKLVYIKNGTWEVDKENPFMALFNQSVQVRHPSPFLGSD